MKRKLKQIYNSNDYIDSPEELEIILNDDYQTKILTIQKMINKSDFKIRSINVDLEELLQSDFDEFEKENFRVGTSYISVYGDGSWWLYIFCKYDPITNFEYELINGNKNENKK